MPNKTIYVKDREIWQLFKDLASEQRISLSLLIEKAMKEYALRHRNDWDEIAFNRRELQTLRKNTNTGEK